MMGLLFSTEGKKRLDEVARPGLLCAFDFDGTLAPLVPMPDQASLPDDIREGLIALAAHAPVAIITGRSIEDIRTRIGFDPDYVIGNHGLEGVPGWEEHAEKHRSACRTWMAQLADDLPKRLGDAGIMVEDKHYSLSVHYRQARDPEMAARALESLFGDLSPRPRIIGGKYVFNLLADDASNKGIALERLMAASGAQRAIYVGDDVTDEDVFRMRRPNVLSVRIERHADSAASYFLAHPSDILQLLEELTARLRATRARNWVQAEIRSRA